MKKTYDCPGYELVRVELTTRTKPQQGALRARVVGPQFAASIWPITNFSDQFVDGH